MFLLSTLIVIVLFTIIKKKISLFTALKRKDHLTRHKQSHNPERPFVCTICLKAFKRKEQLTLHFVSIVILK